MELTSLISGTAGVALAGLLASLRISGMRMRDHKLFFMGAGSVGCAKVIFNVRDFNAGNRFYLGQLWYRELFGTSNGHRGNVRSGSVESHLDV